MPTAALRACAAIGCRELVSKGRCPQHAKQADAGTRGTAHQRGYTHAWSAFSKSRLARLPFCGLRPDGTYDVTNSRCVQQGRLKTLAQCTDHIIPLRQGGAMYDESNLLSLCLACNSWKEATIERGGIG